MAGPISVSLDDRELRRHIRRVTQDKVIARAMAKALNRTAFEVLEAEKDHTRQAFGFSGAGTERYLAGRGSYRFVSATADSLEVAIFPRTERGIGGRSLPITAGRIERMLLEHRAGATISAGGSVERLEVGGLLAVPLGSVRRSAARGRVPKRLQPATLLGEGRGFIAGRALLERTGRRGRGRVVARYALIEQAKLDPVFRFYDVARGAIDRNFIRKAREEFRRVRFGR